MPEIKQSKNKKRKFLILILLVLVAASCFALVFYKKSEAEKENYEANVEEYLFKSSYDIEHKGKKEIYTYNSEDKESFIFKEASEAVEYVINDREFLFLLNADEAKKDAASFEKFLIEELEFEIASAVINIEDVYQLKDGMYEIISNSYFYSKYNDSKTLVLKTSTILNLEKRELKSIKSSIENFIFQENDTLHELKREEVTKYRDYLEEKRIVVEDLVEVETLSTEKDIENPKIVNEQDKTIDEFTEFLNRN